MARKKKAAAAAPKAEPPAPELVNWACVFNGDRAVFTDRPVCAKHARDAGYAYFTWHHELYAIAGATNDDVHKLGPADRLDGGVWVTRAAEAAPPVLSPEPVKHYVVMATAWAYNDEIMHTHEDNPGFPRRVFTTRWEADRCAREMTLRDMKMAVQNDFDAHMGYDHPADFFGLFDIPWHVWADGLRELGLEPPPEWADETDAYNAREPVQILIKWIRANVGKDAYSEYEFRQLKPGDVPERVWTEEQYDYVLGHVQMPDPFYEVCEVP